MPTSVGGDVARAWFVSRSSERKLSAAGTILVTRMVNLYGLLTVGTMGMLGSGLFFQVPFPLAMMAGVLAPAVAGLIALRMVVRVVQESLGRKRRTGRLVNRLAQAVRYLGDFSIVTLLKTYCISLCIHILMAFLLAAAAKAVGGELSVASYLLLSPAINLIAMLPISPGGFGVREWGTVYVLTVAGESEAVGLSVSMVILAFVILQILTGAALYAIRAHHVAPDSTPRNTE